jgi:hypothetical protein
MPLKVVETLTKRRPLLQDMVWREGNMSGGHRISRRRALPSPSWKRINEGIPNAKATQDTVDEACGMLALKNAIDVDLVELNGGAAYRAKQEMAMGEALMNALEDALFYESTKTHPERIMGLSPRLDALSGIPYSAQVVNSQIAHRRRSDQASMWFINWSDDHVYGIVPKGTATGIQYKDMGQVMTPDEDGNEFNAYVGIWKWRCGLCVEDARYVVRLANIDTSAIAKTGKLLIEDMVDCRAPAAGPRRRAVPHLLQPHHREVPAPAGARHHQEQHVLDRPRRRHRRRVVPRHADSRERLAAEHRSDSRLTLSSFRSTRTWSPTRTCT